MTLPTRIIINIHGGLVQDVGCTDPHAEIIVVDWDCSDEECGVPVSTSEGRHVFA